MGYNGNQRAMTVCQWEIMMERMLQQGRAYASFCEKEEPTLYLPEGQNITWDNIKVLNRDVVVTKGTTLTVSCEVRMGENKRIVVHRGGKLIVDDGKITNLCIDKRWAGIAVHGNAERTQPNPFGVQQADDAGIVIILNNSTIEHARTAISTSAPGWPWPDSEKQFGGVVHAENSHFINNGRVAEFMKYDFENKSQFINCEMYGNDEALSPTRGVTIWDCDGIYFSDNDFYDLDGTAIYGIDFGANIVNGNTFTGCGRGIEVLATHPFATWLEISDNTFSDNNLHIVANASSGRSGLRIHGNRFSNSTLGVAGVWIEGDSRFNITNNAFMTDTRGVAALQTGSFYNIIDNNSFETTILGLDIIGDNRTLQFSSNCFKNTVYDVNLQAVYNGALGQVRAVQSKNSGAADNCFAEMNFADINAPVGQTVNFVYAAPSTLTDVCYLPSNNLSDGGVNNYIVQFVNFYDEACSDNVGGGVVEGDKEKLLRIRDRMNGSFQQMLERPNNRDALLAYENDRAEYDVLQASLLNTWIREGNFVDADAVLALDQSKVGQRNRMGLKLLQKDYGTATQLLNSYPVEDADDGQFKTIQEINLQRLQGGSAFQLTPSQEQWLTTTAAQQGSPHRGYAAAMLGLLNGATFHVSLPTPVVAQGFIQSPSVDNGGIESPYQVFPNPATREITVVYPEAVTTTHTKVMCKLQNIQGQVVLETALDGSGKQNILLPNGLEGVFFLTVDAGGELLHQHRVVVIRQ